eukprot:1148984-Amphidinium_carterae.1
MGEQETEDREGAYDSGWDYDSSNDSEGTYATPHYTNETPTFEEDLTWEQEDLEEERREEDEVVSVSPERALPKAAVRQIPRPSVVDPQPPPWTEPTPSPIAMEEQEEEDGEEEDPSVDTDATEDYSWLWRQEGHDYRERASYFRPVGRFATRALVPNPWRERVASKAMPKQGAGRGRSRAGRASGRGRASFGGRASLETQLEMAADGEQQVACL